MNTNKWPWLPAAAVLCIIFTCINQSSASPFHSPSSSSSSQQQQLNDEQQIQSAIRLLSQVWETRKNLDSLKKNLNDIDTNVHKTQKRWGAQCAIGAGMAGYMCHLVDKNNDDTAMDWIENSKLSPGKRALVIKDMNSELEGLNTKSQSIKLLREILAQLNDKKISNIRRTLCRLNGGSDCDWLSDESKTNRRQTPNFLSKLLLLAQNK